MAEQEIASNLTFWMWVITGCASVIGALIGVVFWFTHDKIDKNKADVTQRINQHEETIKAQMEKHAEEAKGEVMKNDRDHREFWQGFKSADKDRQAHCLSRAEYEKDTQHTSEAIMEMKVSIKEIEKNMKTVSELMVAHMATDKRG